ncbi:hypothetical protein Rhopal_004973-T1 [Rhodotorula paludigena]|uniref:Ribonuclease T2-like n=1 Tax=Rhodotorula paludigena TaxID=86838 RepID=A0AAV5GPY2_9BASI|nr:hypothetical protein Rhopal_004973-T1 [Rhodotorula paludigena]
MTRTAAFALTAAALASTAVAAPEPFLRDLLGNIWNKVEDKLHDVQDKAIDTFGLKACPAPFLLPNSCTNGQSPQIDNLNTCCTNVPGGLVLLTQFWNARPDIGPNNSWTIHGLWPDNCDGTYEQYCDKTREYSNIREILTSKGETKMVEYFDTHWKSNTGDDESLWSHEWDKHGTCMSTLETQCYGRRYQQYDEVVDYFERTYDQYRKLPTYDWLAAEGIVPSLTDTYTLAQLQAAAQKKFGHKIFWGCTNSGELDEAWYYYTVKGPIAGGQFIPVEVVGRETSCSNTDAIKYIPKGVSGGNNGGSVPSGDYSSAFLNAEYEGKQTGCLISKGVWFTSGTCATYRLYPSTEGAELTAGFTMTTSKGPCTVSQGAELSCASGNIASTFAIDSNNYLTYEGSSQFYAKNAAAGQAQEPVYTSSSEASVPFKINIGAPQ